MQLRTAAVIWVIWPTQAYINVNMMVCLSSPESNFLMNFNRMFRKHILLCVVLPSLTNLAGSELLYWVFCHTLWKRCQIRVPLTPLRIWEFQSNLDLNPGTICTGQEISNAESLGAVRWRIMLLNQCRFLHLAFDSAYFNVRFVITGREPRDHFAPILMGVSAAIQ